MKVQDIIDTINDIGEVRQILFSATDEGTFINKDVVEMIERIIDDYENDLLKLEVNHE